MARTGHLKLNNLCALIALVTSRVDDMPTVDFDQELWAFWTLSQLLA